MSSFSVERGGMIVTVDLVCVGCSVGFSAGLETFGAAAEVGAAFVEEGACLVSETEEGVFASGLDFGFDGSCGALVADFDDGAVEVSDFFLIGEGRPDNPSRCTLPTIEFLDMPRRRPISPVVTPSSQSFLSVSTISSVQAIGNLLM